MMALQTRRVLGLLSTLALSALIVQAAEEGEKPKKERPPRPKMEKVKGVINAVDMEAKTITITTEGGEQVLTLDVKSMIMLKGPILDGLKAGDTVDAMMADQALQTLLAGSSAGREPDCEPDRRVGLAGGPGISCPCRERRRCAASAA